MPARTRAFQVGRPLLIGLLERPCPRGPGVFVQALSIFRSPAGRRADHGPALRRSRAFGLFPSGSLFFVIRIVIQIVIHPDWSIDPGADHHSRPPFRRRRFRPCDPRLRFGLRFGLRFRKPTCPIIFCPGTRSSAAELCDVCSKGWFSAALGPDQSL